MCLFFGLSCAILQRCGRHQANHPPFGLIPQVRLDTTGEAEALASVLSSKLEKLRVAAGLRAVILTADPCVQGSHT